ncbi:Kp4-domain-containing protein [Apodospora peruviana]|uniref:Kp4-domain-containing protein n=1 Tax=Apodospora peruviana TaxID=516989 RepID=A0AAE0HV00_9PEZI|nr:Kp4-domain-containing protein [Apodospora peruviana]
MKFTTIFTTLAAASGILAVPLAAASGILAVPLAAASGILAVPLAADADQSENPANLREPRALGINCRGSSFCGCALGGAGAAERLQSLHFQNGEHIACTQSAGSSGFWAFLQATNRDVNGAAIRSLINYIVGHNCRTCGSVPIDYPGSNDPKNGILAINYVFNTRCCEGLCQMCFGFRLDTQLTLTLRCLSSAYPLGWGMIEFCELSVFKDAQACKTEATQDTTENARAMRAIQNA